MANGALRREDFVWYRVRHTQQRVSRLYFLNHRRRERVAAIRDGVRTAEGRMSPRGVVLRARGPLATVGVRATKQPLVVSLCRAAVLAAVFALMENGGKQFKPSAERNTARQACNGARVAVECSRECARARARGRVRDVVAYWPALFPSGPV